MQNFNERCWKGYEPVPGKKKFSPGSCRKKFKEWLLEQSTSTGDIANFAKPLLPPIKRKFVKLK